MSVVWDRDAARDVLSQRAAYMPHPSELEAVLDALEGCVRPAPAQTIDRDALAAEIGRLRADEVVRSGHLPQYTDQAWADRLLALLRPVDGSDCGGEVDR